MDVLMPQLGETVAEGKITKWFKSAGDAVKPGDNLFEIETDKVSMEVPSTTAGTLRGDPRRRRRGGAGRRGGRGDRGRRRGRAAATLRQPLLRSSRAKRLRLRQTGGPASGGTSGPAARAPSASRSIRSSKSARPSAISVRRDWRRHGGDAAGAPARLRGRHRSRPHRAIRPARPDRGARRGGRGRDAAARVRLLPRRAGRRRPR